MKKSENPPGKRPARSLRFYWSLSILLISAALTGLFTVLLTQHRIADLTAASDAQLLTAAEMAHEIAGADFHDHISGPDSVSPQQFEQILARNDNLCRRLGLQYLWSVLQVGDDLVFTTATHSDINDPNSPAASFYEVHRDPGSFSAALGVEMQPVFSSFDNEWGRGRQVLIPRKDALGRTYIFGASIQMEAYDALFRQTLFNGLLTGGGLLVVFFLLELWLARRLTDPILRLTESADRMASGDLEAPLPGGKTREVQSLSSSFERLRLNLRLRILELQVIEPRLSLAVRAGGVGIWDWDCVANTLVWDKQMYALYGINKDSFGGVYESWRAGLHPEDVERCDLEIAQALRGEKDFNTEFRVVWPDGSAHDIQAMAVVMRDVDGKPLRMTGTNWDITGHKRTEEALRVSEEWYRAIYDSSPLAMVVWDHERRVVDWNGHAEQVFGWSRDEILGKDFFEFLLPKSALPSVAEVVDLLLAGTLPSQSINENITKHGETILCEWNNSIRFNSKGEVTGAISLALDITERKQAEEMIRRTNNLLLAKNKELEQMVYVASHDLRSPLVNIDGYSRELKLIVDELESGLLQGALPEEVTSTASSSLQEMRGDLHYILSSTAQMDGLLSGLLKLSRSGRAALNITNLDVDTLVTQVLAAVEFQVLESRMSIERSPLPACRGDAVAVSQVFANLVNNALKFRHPERPGILRISGTIEGNQAIYCLEDNGIGIAPAYQEKIFDLFQRLDPEAYPGEGLGLTIVRQTLYRLGGSVRVESEPGSGSRFYVSIPRDMSGAHQI